MKYTLTHKGWFGICPVYYANPYNDPEPFLIERRWAFYPVFWISEVMLEAVMMFVELLGGDAPGYPLRITGKIKPIDVEIEP